MPVIPNNKRWVLLITALLLLAWEIASLARSAILQTNDFVQYWSAGKMLLSGGDPYSPKQVLELERSLGKTGGIPLIPFSPPWALTFMAPLALIEPFLWQKRTKVIAGFLAGPTVLGVIALLGVGWQGLRSYPPYVWQSEHSNMYRWNNFHGNTTNLRGLLLTELPGGELPQNARLVQGLLIVSSLTVLGIVGWTWLRLKSFASPEGELAFALNLVAALLVSYHAFVQDMSLLFMAILLVLNVLFSNPRFQG